LRPRFVLYRPGRRIAVRYRARLAWPDGRSRDVTLGATERRSGPPAGSTVVERDGATVAVWRWPDDPQLPGLRAAASPGYVRALLDEYGAPPGPIYLSTKSYWPGRRAVIQATLPSPKLRFDAARARLGQAPAKQLIYIKVVRPGEAQPLYELHAKLGAVLPVARCPGGSDELGILVLEALSGSTLGDWLSHGASALPAGTSLLDLLRRLEPFDLGDVPRTTTGQKVENHVRLLRKVLPDQSDLLDRFVADYGEERPQPLTTVHGDFHEAQVLVQGGQVSGLLDVDDVGPGQLVDDLALMIGRVWALAYFGKGDRESIRRYAEHLLEVFGAAVDADELRRRVAGALLGRATGPFRAQERGWPAETRARLRLAENWLSRCERDGVPR
jgi:hypothetical protein